MALYAFRRVAVNDAVHLPFGLNAFSLIQLPISLFSGHQTIKTFVNMPKLMRS